MSVQCLDYSLDENELDVLQNGELLSALAFDCHDADDVLTSTLFQIYYHELRVRAKAKDVPQLHAAAAVSIKLMRDGFPSIEREAVRDTLRVLGHGEPWLDDAIDVGLTMWLKTKNASMDSDRSWKGTETLQDFTKRCYYRAEIDPMEPIVRFPREFRAVELEKIAGVKVTWTWNLSEHLAFGDDDGKNRFVRIFNDKRWLSACLESPACTGVPRDVILETIKTLDILFPLGNSATSKFLQSQGQSLHLVGPFPDERPRLREFRYWRERLIDLIVEFEEPPRDWTRIWRDRRYPATFWTFWLGLLIFILTLLFGITASVLAGFALMS
ncbi:hypothetical protein K431DRAFT_345503 [Polychaeton citri CBS 116435]|uniref:Uncharacterized protein n=1 Tax=Polychaeton citri CBS 116435 TaxID=1314669 RepID=A0A9P4QCV6_9PEZI|nr:hypothetical protein K431DRAFT_345503 [Polychaeton citri CBS 116435]